MANARTILYVRPAELEAPATAAMKRITDEWLTTLSQTNDVVTIEGDFDYAQACERVQPNFVVFEAPGHYRPAPPKLTNADARPDIPRMMFLCSDPEDTIRCQMFRMADELGIDALFADPSHLQETPELSGRTYTMSTFLDPEIFRDHQLPRDIPVSIFGGRHGRALYNWRSELVDVIHDVFPTLIYPHPTYYAPAPHLFAIFGDDYARMLSRSRFSLADGTRFHHIVRKHLEIPACGSVLVAQNIQILGDYGFVHMQNCVLGSGRELLNAMAAVAANPELYETIRRGGHDVVQSRHMRDAWTVFTDWYEATRANGAGRIVRQNGIHGPFASVADDGAGLLDARAPHENEYTAILTYAERCIRANTNLEDARARLGSVYAWLDYLMEPCLLLGIISLMQGKPQQALDEFSRPLRMRTARDKVTCWDPQEIAWLLFTCALLGRTDDTANLRAAAAGTRHLSLRRMEWLLAGLPTGVLANPDPALEAPHPRDRISVHWFGRLTLAEWVSIVDAILIANNYRPQTPTSS